MLDIFRDDAFGTVALTDAALKSPYKPGRIGALGLFRERGVRSTTVVVEEKDGQFSLIQTSPRGGVGSTLGASKRRVRPFVAPHLEREATIMADEVQGVRAFGSETDVESIQMVVNERLSELRAMHEVTLEHLRVGAVKGQILDADGVTVLFDLFSEFGVSQQTREIDLASADTNVRNEAVAIQRMSEDELGAETVSGYRAFCGDDFFDALIEHPSVVESLKFQESAMLRTDMRTGFEYGGITWENYRGRVGSVDFFEPEEAYVVPVGTSLFATYFAPADFLETVNTIGLPIYAKSSIDQDLGRWAKLHTQSNPLPLCLRPRAVVKLTMAT